MVFQVEDSGPGIPAGEEERVFEPFYRGTGSEGNGSGLGLAIVSGIAERLGGRATLTNRENSRGALFRYTQQQSHGRAS
jgi:signal transduction histidine kinase